MRIKSTECAFDVDVDVDVRNVVVLDLFREQWLLSGRERAGCGLSASRSGFASKVESVLNRNPVACFSDNSMTLTRS